MIIYFRLSLLSIHVPLWESEHSSLPIVCSLTRSPYTLTPSLHQDRDESLNNGSAALWPDQLHSLVMTRHADGGRAEKHMFTDLSSVERSPLDCTLCMLLHREDLCKSASPTSSPAQSPSPATPVSLPDWDPWNAPCLLKRSLDAQVTIEVAKDKPWRSLGHNFPPCALWSWSSSVPPHTLPSACVLVRMVLVQQKQQSLDLLVHGSSLWPQWSDSDTLS